MFGLKWSSGVVLHDSWCVVVLLKDIIQLTGVSGRLKARKNGFGERFQVLGESGGAQIRLAEEVVQEERTINYTYPQPGIKKPASVPGQNSTDGPGQF